MGKGLSKGAIISLILKYVGGQPLVPVPTVKIGGSLATKQLLEALGNLPGPLGSLASQVASGGLGSILENPIAGALGSINGVLTGAGLSNLTSGLNSLVSAGKLSLGDFNAITGKLGELGGTISSLANHTDSLVGLATSAIENGPSFGALTSAAETLKGFGSDLFGAADLITSATGSLDIGPSILNAKTFIDNLVSQIDTGAISGSSAVTILNNYKTTFQTNIDSDVSAFSTVTSKLENVDTFSTVLATAKSDIPAIKTLVDRAVKSEALSVLRG